MGTRHLIAVQLDGEYKVAQYGQWDGYPEGQGKRIVEFLGRYNMETFKQKLRLCSFLTEEEVERFNEAIKERGETETWPKKYPYLSRDAGAKVLDMISLSDIGLILINQIDFSGDSLFCEFAYVINLDDEYLELYKGFNKEPLKPSERFYVFDNGDDDQGYRAVKFVAKYPFMELPTVEQMEKDFGCDEDE